MDFVFKMAFSSVLVGTTILLILIINVSCTPGGHNHVHHRIIVPQKIRTIYHTKIIKVPEHHHHFHEKEKIIIQKEEPKKEHHEIPLLLEEDHHEWEGLESSHVFKKKRFVNPSHAPKTSIKHSKKRRIILPTNHHYEEEE